MGSKNLYTTFTVMKNRMFVIILSVLTCGVACSPSGAIQPTGHEDQPIVELPKEESDKFIDIQPERITFSILEGLSKGVTTAIPTAIGRYEIRFSDNNAAPIWETIFVRTEKPIIVNPLETDFFLISREDDKSYNLELFSAEDSGAYTIVIEFYPLEDKTYLFGQLTIEGR